MEEGNYSDQIPLTQFKDYVNWMKSNSGYIRHLQAVDEVGEGQPQTASEQRCNEYKNRYINILPYDHSRVRLSVKDGEEGSDYINATYMPGDSSKQEYIASQGPLEHTADDFWRMVWEQQANNIVMLTKCLESGWEICYQYWPDCENTRTYGDIQVAFLSEESCSDWNIRNFSLTKDGVNRDVRHFHFKSWPDYGVPKREQALVRFNRAVRADLLPSEGPLIVHCSAGVGRTGTFLVVDRLLQHIRDHDSVSIYTTLAELRQERMWMVQTVEQYQYIHKCLQCVLEAREDIDM